MGRASVRIGAVLGVVALGSGCGGGAGAPAPTADEFGARYLAAFCQKLLSCCSKAQLAKIDSVTPVVDEPSCEAVLAPDFQSEVTQDPQLVTAGYLTYSAAAAQACLAQVAALPCGTPPPGAVSQCGEVFKGTVALGSACATDAQCVSGFCTTSSSGYVCAATAGAGEPCNLAPCSAGLACLSSPSGGPGTCGQPLPDGSACMYDTDCAGGLCAIPNAASSGTCTTLALCAF